MTSVFPASTHCGGGTWLSSAREILERTDCEAVGFTSAEAKPNDPY